MIMPTLNNNLLCAVQGSHFGICNPSQSRKGQGVPFLSQLVTASSISISLILFSCKVESTFCICLINGINFTYGWIITFISLVVK
jgi:hypothetical protein